MPLDWGDALENVQRGETLSNVFILSGTVSLANLADKLEQFLQNGIVTGKAYLKVLSEMMRTIDVSPNLKETVQMVNHRFLGFAAYKINQQIQMDIQVLQSALDDLERNARLKNVMVKATSECVTPQRGAISKIKDETYM